MESLRVQHRASLLTSLLVAMASFSPGAASAQPSRKYFYEDIFTPFFARDDAAGVYRGQRPGSSLIAEQSQFPIRKIPGTFRVFVIGGSIAGRYMSGPDNLGAVLKQVLPTKRIEVISCGMSGYDSYREAMILEEVLDYEPDLIVLLTGHNERVGSPPVPLWILHARDRMNRWASYLDRVERYFKSNGEVFKFTPEEVARRDRAFGSNLRDMVRHAKRRGVAIAIALPPLNYRQAPPYMPLALYNPTTARGWLLYLGGNARAAAVLWRKALKAATNEQEIAGLRFLQGLADEDLRDWSSAQREFSTAIDSDRGISRCAQGCRNAIQDVTRQNGGILVDLDGAFRRQALPRAPGLDMFDDAVHWWYGYNLLATMEIIKALRGQEPFHSWKWDDVVVESLNRRSLRRHDPRQEDETLATLRYALSEMDHPDPNLNWRAVTQLQAVFERFPQWFDDPAALLRRAKEGSDANVRDFGMVSLQTSLPVFYWYMGEMRVRRKEFARAMDDFDRALALDPKLQIVLLSRSVAQHLSGDEAGARRSLQAARENHQLGPGADALSEAMGLVEEALAHQVDLGVADFTAGHFGDSEEHFLAAVRLSPEDLSAWSSLAAVYIADGKPELAAGVNKRILTGICSRVPRQSQCSLFSEASPRTPPP